jgi:hypothetical protein
MKTTLLAALFAIAIPALANPPGSQEPNGNGCTPNCGNGAGGQGGNGGAGGTNISAVTNANGASANSGDGVANGSSANTNTFSSRAYALSAGSIGSPANDTCVAHASYAWGGVTVPREIASCQALNEALFLVKLGETKAAVERLCQLPSIGATSLCPKAQGPSAPAKVSLDDR